MKREDLKVGDTFTYKETTYTVVELYKDAIATTDTSGMRSTFPNHVIDQMLA